jgi:hypothetical protein
MQTSPVSNFKSRVMPLTTARTCLLVVLATTGAYLGADVVRPKVVSDDELAARPIDIQTPDGLIPKLEALCRHSGPKIVVAGDSLIFGETMQAHGDPDWRDHTLPAQLQQDLQSRNPELHVMVLNLGINGMLPGDLEHLTRLLAACRVDWLVVNVHLRPFSRDFWPEASRLARPWLRHLEATNGTFQYRPSEPSARDQVEREPWSTLREASGTYRHREAIQSIAIESPAATAVQGIRNRIVPKAATRSRTDSGILLLQLKERMKSVEITDDNPQVQALDRALRQWSASGARALVFYARENPNQLDELIEPDRYQHLTGELERRIRGRYPGVAFANSCPALTPSDYLDFSHLNHAGYRALTSYLSPFITPPIVIPLIDPR